MLINLINKIIEYFVRNVKNRFVSVKCVYKRLYFIPFYH